MTQAWGPAGASHDAVLPDRRGRRSDPRVSYRKRGKTTKFEKQNPTEATKIREEKRKNALE